MRVAAAGEPSGLAKRPIHNCERTALDSLKCSPLACVQDNSTLIYTSCTARRGETWLRQCGARRRLAHRWLLHQLAAATCQPRQARTMLPPPAPQWSTTRKCAIITSCLLYTHRRGAAAAGEDASKLCQVIVRGHRRQRRPPRVRAFSWLGWRRALLVRLPLSACH